MRGSNSTRPHPKRWLRPRRIMEGEIPGLGIGFIAEVGRIAGILQEQPKIWLKIEKGFRRVLMARFPYSLIYQPRPERLWIVAVAHQYRRPGFWQQRVER